MLRTSPSNLHRSIYQWSRQEKHDGRAYKALAPKRNQRGLLSAEESAVNVDFLIIVSLLAETNVKEKWHKTKVGK